jgi:CHRD domain
MTARPFVAVFLTAVICLCTAPLHAQNQEKFKARLSTIAMDGGMRETVAGTGTASAVLAGTKLTINGTFEGLRSPATVGRLHGGLAMGVRGAPVGDLTVAKATSGTITGSLDLTPDQVQSLKAGRLYIQIASEKAPEGNLWGWLVR